MKIALLLVSALGIFAGCRYERSGETAASVSNEWASLTALACVAAPGPAELLDESGAFALFSGETAEDSAYNQTSRYDSRNSLFLRRRRPDGAEEWRMLLTTGSGWREADGMGAWCSTHTRLVKGCFCVQGARFASDGRHLWLVCESNFATFRVICSYDTQANTLRVIIDGDTADEQPDGTILVKNTKTYLSDENGEPLGARWYDAWIAPDGKVVRKGKLKTAEEVD